MTSDQVFCRSEEVEWHALEWMQRQRPDWLVPVTLVPREDGYRMDLYPEGLPPLCGVLDNALNKTPDPDLLLRSLLGDLRDRVEEAAACLLDPARFRRDADSLYAAPDTEAAIRPVLLYVPTDPTSGSVSDDPLTVAAAMLVACLDQLPASVRHRPAVLAFRTALDGDREDLEAIPETDCTGTVDPDPDPPDRPRARQIRWLVLAAALLTAVVPRGLRMALYGADVPLFDPVLPDAVSLTGLLCAAGLLLWPTVRSASRTVISKLRPASLLPDLTRWLRTLWRDPEPTQPVTDPGEDRLGYLSEHPPGSAAEQDGLRAYLLTAEFVIGRDPDQADLVIPDAEVGRRHARVTRREGQFFLTDLGSVNGTYLDHRRLTRHTENRLPDRCEIRFGTRRFYFTVDEP